MNNTISAKCYSRILNDLRKISLILRRSRKLSWKKGGVDCRVSRRERDIPNTFVPTPYLPHCFSRYRHQARIPSALHSSHLQIKSLKVRFRIEYFPTYRGEIESVNMTYVIAARIEK